MTQSIDKRRLFCEIFQIITIISLLLGCTNRSTSAASSKEFIDLQGNSISDFVHFDCSWLDSCFVDVTASNRDDSYIVEQFRTVGIQLDTREFEAYSPNSIHDVHQILVNKGFHFKYDYYDKIQSFVQYEYYNPEGTECMRIVQYTTVSDTGYYRYSIDFEVMDKPYPLLLKEINSYPEM